MIIQPENLMTLFYLGRLPSNFIEPPKKKVETVSRFEQTATVHWQVWKNAQITLQSQMLPLDVPVCCKLILKIGVSGI